MTRGGKLAGGNFRSRSCILFVLLFLRKTRDHTRRLPLFAVNKSINDGEYRDSFIRSVTAKAKAGDTGS